MHDNIEHLLKEIVVYDCGMKKLRIGNQCDGGYVTLDDVNKKSEVLCTFGVEDNVTFELDFASHYPHCSVHLFDHTIGALPQQHPNFIFYQKGVAPITTKNMLGLGEIIEELGDNIILKMDIEWDEWKVLDSLAQHHLHKISQLIVEFHLVTIDVENKFIPSTQVPHQLTPYFKGFYKSVYEKVNEDLVKNYHKVLKKLNQHFYAFHIHPNNSLAKITYGDYTFPPLLEMSFVRKDLVKNVVPTQETYPINGLDYPNKPYKPEIKNYYPLV